MKLSLFTPTHNPRHIQELYESIKRQEGNVDWEWVIVLNGKWKDHNVKLDFSGDKHVRVMTCTLQGIGALKKFACDQCKGDVFIEMDHDDLLAPNTFQELAKAYEKEPTGFYYSDFINLKPDGSCETYGAKFGWEQYSTTIEMAKGPKNYTACRAFAPTARSLCHIYFAPNHVRAWSRVAYEKSGGHDPALAVGDDHDLVCRTYIAGSPFVWIQEPLYIYRRWNEQSFVKFNKDIQVQQNLNCNKYLHQLIECECLREHGIRVDIGRTEWCADDFHGHDLIRNDFNLSMLKDDTVSYIRGNDCLQRVPRDKIVQTMNEIYRVLKPGGWFLSSTPAIDDGDGKVGRGVFQDPSHCSYWSTNNFWYFTQRKYAGMLADYVGRFQAVRLWTAYPSDWHKQNVIPYVFADLCALKGQRQPGEQQV